MSRRKKMLHCFGANSNILKRRKLNGLIKLIDHLLQFSIAFCWLIQIFVKRKRLECQECFDQQYSNNIANLGTLHTIRKIAVIAPLGAFYIQIPANFELESEGAADGDFAHQTPNFLRRETGENLVVYSSISSSNLEWQKLDVLTSALKIVSVFEGDNMQSVSPVIIITACPHKTRAIYFDSQPFVVSRHESGLVSMYENELIVNFKTFENGIFFFSMADQGDLLVAQLNGGQVETYFDFGSLSRSLLSGGKALNDGEWHELHWTHQYDSVQLFVDKVLVNSTTPSGLYRKLDLNHQVEVGGRPEDQYSTEIQTSFHGCLARVQLNNIDLIQFAPKSARECQIPQPQMMTIHSGIVQIAYSFLPFTLEFRIPNKAGSLLAILNAANETLLEIIVDESRMLVLEAELRQIRQTSVPPLIVNDGNWHTLSVKLSGGRLDIELDSATVLWLEGPLVRKIGLKMTAFRLSASGCYRSTTVDLRSSVPLDGAQIFRDKCLFSEKCLPNPCENNGVCIQSELSKFHCECDKNYAGTICHTSLLPRSCEDYRLRKRPVFKHPLLNGVLARHLEKNGADETVGDSVTIDLDGGGPLKPLQVTCLFIPTAASAKIATKQKAPTSIKFQDTSGSSNSGDSEESNDEMVRNNNNNDDEIDEEEGEVTILHNNSPVSGFVVADGLTEPGAIRRTLEYGNGVDGIELNRFVEGFHFCRQYMRFECRGGTKLMTYGTERRPSTWYATRNGQHGLQWADAPPYSRMCSCSLNSTCDGNKMCNCDNGRDGVDEGWNTYQQLLPVLQLFIGGTTGTPGSSANVSIGPLRCTRRRVFDAITFIDRNQQLVGAQNFKEPVFDFYAQLKFAHAQMTIFTWESANAQRWFQLLVREGKLVGQLVNAGQTHELISDVTVNDNRWHTVYWEIDHLSMKMVVDRNEKSISSFFLLPFTYTYIIGSRTGRSNSGFAGQIRSLYLAGQEVPLAEMVEKLHPLGIRLGETGYCEAQHGATLPSKRCTNEGECVEFYDKFKCNCSNTPFGGEKCDQEVGMWVPLGSQISIPWQHPSQMSSTCYRMNVYTASADVTLMRAKALFAESSFNMSIDVNGHLNVQMYDGFFFHHNVTFEKFALNDSKIKDMKFCASKTEFRLLVNEETAILMEGNFTFFQNLNAWNFVDKNFTGCVSRLKIGGSYPLKVPSASRLLYSPGVKFGSCPFNSLEYYKSSNQYGMDNEAEGSSSNSDIQITAIVKSQQRLLIITPAIGLFAALLLAVALCTFVCYMRSRPDGVYKTNENLIGFPPDSSCTTLNRLSPSSKSVDPLVVHAVNARHNTQINYDNNLLQRPSANNGGGLHFSKEYFC